jgi:hypothetical protein
MKCSRQAPRFAASAPSTERKWTGSVVLNPPPADTPFAASAPITEQKGDWRGLAPLYATVPPSEPVPLLRPRQHTGPPVRPLPPTPPPLHKPPQPRSAQVRRGGPCLPKLLCQRPIPTIRQESILTNPHHPVAPCPFEPHVQSVCGTGPVHERGDLVNCAPGRDRPRPARCPIRPAGSGAGHKGKRERRIHHSRSSRLRGESAFLSPPLRQERKGEAGNQESIKIGTLINSNRR